jgi:hypothetical protein
VRKWGREDVREHYESPSPAGNAVLLGGDEMCHYRNNKLENGGSGKLWTVIQDNGVPGNVDVEINAPSRHCTTYLTPSLRDLPMNRLEHDTRATLPSFFEKFVGTNICTDHGLSLLRQRSTSTSSECMACRRSDHELPVLHPTFH